MTDPTPHEMRFVVATLDAQARALRDSAKILAPRPPRKAPDGGDCAGYGGRMLRRMAPAIVAAVPEAEIEVVEPWDEATGPMEVGR